MTSLKQKKTFSDTLENIKNGTPLTKKELLLKNGYSLTVADKPSLVFDSKYFKNKLAKIDDTKILDKWYEWATDESDRRVSVQCGENIMKLKDRYPASKSKVIGLFETLDSLEDEQPEPLQETGVDTAQVPGGDN